MGRDEVWEAYPDDNCAVQLSYKSGRAYSSSNKEHAHKEYEIYYLVAGSKTFHVNKHEYFLKSGDVMFIPPEISHRSVWMDSSSLSNRIILLFSDSLLEGGLTFAGSPRLSRLLSGGEQHISLSPAGRSEFEIVMKYLNNELASSDSECFCMRQMYVLQLCICLLRHGTGASFEKPRRNADNMQAIQDYIHENYNKSLTLDSFASLFFMNPSAMARSFKAATGTTIISYINQLRVERAKEMLEQKSLPVAEVAKRVGFNTGTYFERVFKKNTGLTPSEFRRRIKLE